MTEIKRIEKTHLDECLSVIHRSFATVANAFGLTEQNCPKHPTFMKDETLQRRWEYVKISDRMIR